VASLRSSSSSRLILYLKASNHASKTCASSLSVALELRESKFSQVARARPMTVGVKL